MSNVNFESLGCIMVLSGPSSSGKTTITKKLLETEPELAKSVSVTTRSPRATEEEGLDYYFMDQSTFSSMILTGQLLEYTKLYGNYYGTPKKELEGRINMGLDVIFDLDPNGAKAIKEKIPLHSFSIYILPPSFAELDTRMRKRGQDSQMNMVHRINKAKEEIKRVAEYDYVVVNNDIEETCANVRSILQAERLKRSRILNLEEYLDNL